MFENVVPTIRGQVAAARRRIGHAHRRPMSPRGQALVEFTLVVPLVLFLLVAILDFSRVFTAMVTIESATREAADFGAFNRVNWSGDRTLETSNYRSTLAAMKARACVASSNLVGFQADPGAGCVNPRYPDGFTEADILIDPVDGDNSDCHVADRETPCLVRVDLEYQFDTIIPLGIDFMGTRLGLPDDPTFVRSSIFAVGDFELDES